MVADPGPASGVTRNGPLERLIDVEGRAGSAEPLRTGAAAPADDPRSAVERLVSDHRDEVRRVVYAILHDADEAEDVTQVACERALRRFGDLRQPDAARSWLLSIAVREALSVRRRWGRLVRFGSPPVEALVRPIPVDQDLERRLDLLAAFDRLPVGQRTALALHYYAGLTVAEAAGVAGVPLETMRSRVKAGLGRLRRDLGEGEGVR